MALTDWFQTLGVSTLFSTAVLGIARLAKPTIDSDPKLSFEEILKEDEDMSKLVETARKDGHEKAANYIATQRAETRSEHLAWNFARRNKQDASAWSKIMLIVASLFTVVSIVLLLMGEVPSAVFSGVAAVAFVVWAMREAHQFGKELGYHRRQLGLPPNGKQPDNNQIESAQEQIEKRSDKEED